MKSTTKVLIAIGVAFTIGNHALAADQVALSPRAQANQIRVVSGSGNENTVLAGRELGAAARAKASGQHPVTAATSVAKDIDLARGQNALGFAAKAKATGRTGGSDFQVAPLK